jgi:DNA polymerase V
MNKTNHKLEHGKLYPVDVLKGLILPMIENPIKCGFPSPALDYIETPIDLNELLIKNETATFIFIADGSSMEGEHIPDGALLLIDRSRTPEHGDIILADLNGEFTLKKLDKKLMRLMPANPAFQPIILKEGMQLMVCGVVTAIIINPKGSYVRPGRLQ